MSSWDYAMTQFGAIVGYLRLCFWPSPLVFDYGIPVARTPLEIVPYAALILCLLIVTGEALRWRASGFAGLSFFVILAPTSTIVPLATQPIAEHRMYLPLAAVVAHRHDCRILDLAAIHIVVGRRPAGGGASSLGRAGLGTCGDNGDFCLPDFPAK